MPLLAKADKYVDRKQCRLSCDLELLRRSPVFTGLNLDMVKLFAYLSTHRSCRTGEYLIEQGRPAQQAFVLVKGRVEITAFHQGREIVLQSLEPNSFLGELALLAPFTWYFNARAAEELEALVIDRTAFRKVNEKFPEHRDKLIERIVHLRIDRLSRQTSSLLNRLLDSVDTVSAPII